MNLPAIEVSGVSKRFRTGFWMKPAQVLNQISFSVEQGSVFGFLGGNGAGKTTLIHLIAGIRHPTKGSVQILGKAATDWMSKIKIGYLPERPYFYQHLTSRQFLSHMGKLSGLEDVQIEEKIEPTLNKVGLHGQTDRELGKFSKGMLQRIGLAQAILHDPPVLILDEPMSGLDPAGRKEVRDLIQEMGEAGKTVFFSTHILSDVEKVCDRVGIIHLGNLLRISEPKEFSPSLEEYFNEVIRGKREKTQ